MTLGIAPFLWNSCDDSYFGKLHMQTLNGQIQFKIKSNHNIIDFKELKMASCNSMKRIAVSITF